MRIAMEAAKFNSSEINELRRALATFRRRGTIHQLEQRMVDRMVDRGYDPEFAARCFNQIKGFGEYGFPESHAASFAHLVYVSSWIKCHYPAVFCAAILNAQPMGFYAPAQLVRDAREHGVVVLPPDINYSDWACTLEPPSVDRMPSATAMAPAPRSNHAVRSDIPQPCVRLGLSQIDGLREDDAHTLIQARGTCAYSTLEDAWRRSGVSTACLEKLAAADAMRSLGRDRRQALWDVKALASDAPLPLFSWTGAEEHGQEPATALPEMALGEHVVNDYQTLRLSLKAHPLSFLRETLRREGVVANADLERCRDGTRVCVAGVVLVRQRPGSAKGVVFMTLEDETGVCNTVVWPNLMERYRKVLMTARLVFVRGTIQRHDAIIHVVSKHLEDRSDLLFGLSDMGEEMKIPIANADEVIRPDPGGIRSPDHPRWAGHPRNERVIPKRVETILPKSRDFH